MQQNNHPLKEAVKLYKQGYKIRDFSLIYPLSEKPYDLYFKFSCNSQVSRLLQGLLENKIKDE